MSDNEGENIPGARDVSADVMRGLAIVLVVMGHALRGAIDAHPEAPPAVKSIGWLIYLFHMPAFFYLGGYFTAISLRRRAASTFIKGRWLAIVWPYVAWSTIYFVSSLVFSHFGRVNQPISLNQLVAIPWRPIHVLWFLYALLMLQIIAVVGARWPTAIVICAILADAIVWFAGASSSDSVFIKAALHSPFFFLGFLLASKSIAALPDHSGFRQVLVAFASFGVAAFVLRSVSPDTAVNFVTLPASCAGLISLTLLSSFLASRRPAFSGIFVKLGRASLAIYLLHVLVLAVVPRLLRIGEVDFMFVRVAAGTIAGTLVSYLLYLVMDRANVARPVGLR